MTARALLLMVWRSLRQHAFSTAITVFTAALATALTMSVFSIRNQADAAFTGSNFGFDAVLGARGSQLQLVLNAVFHLETSPGNIPWKMYQAIKEDPAVEYAIPYAVGDNHKGFRIVGTTSEFFEKLEFRKGTRIAVRPGGRFFDTTRMEAVVGSFAAERAGLTVGSTFQPMHGLFYDPKNAHIHAEQYVVVGIMEPTNTPADRVIFIPIEGVFRMGGHVLRGTGEEYKPEAGAEIPDEHKEVSAVMLKLRNAAMGFSLYQRINRQGSVATLAWPIGNVMADLFQKMGWVNRVLAVVAWLVMVVAGATILAALYNSINERRREFAILRAIGARRRVVFSAIVLEAAAIAAMGAGAGLVMYLAIMSFAAGVIRSTTGVVLDVFAYDPSLLATAAGMLVLGVAAGIVPAFRAYSTDVAANLNPIS